MLIVPDVSLLRGLGIDVEASLFPLPWNKTGKPPELFINYASSAS